MQQFPERTKGLLFASCTALCWAVLALLLKHALEFADSASIVAYRMIIAFIGLLIYFSLFKRDEIKKIFKSFPLLALLPGAFLAFNYFGFMKGVELTGAGNAQVMIQIGPSLLLLAGVFIFKELFSLNQFLGVLVTALGFSLFYYDQRGFDVSSTLSLGNYWIIAAALAWAIYASLQKKLSAKWNPQSLNLIIYGLCAFLLSFNADFSASENYNFNQWSLLFLLGINTIVAYGCFAEALKYAPASQVSLIITLNPLGTLAILSAGSYFSIPWIPKESFSIYGFFGALFVVSGIAWTISRKKS